MSKKIKAYKENERDPDEIENALRESEEQHRSTLDSLGDAIHVVDKDLRIVLFNKTFREWCEELGLEKDMVGKRVLEAFPFLPGKVMDEYMEVFAIGKIHVTKESSMVDGNEIITETRKIPVFEKGNVVRIITSVRDITVSKKTEEAVHESEELYRTLLQASPEAIAVIDLDGNLIEVSQQALDVYGFENVEELFDMNPIELIAPEDRKKAVKTIRATLKRGFQRYIEFSLLRKGGSRFIGEVNTAAVRDASGKPKAVIITTRDITDRKRAEEALRSSEEKYRTLAEKAKDFIFIIDRDMKMQYVNSSGVQSLGLPREEIIGKPLHTFFPPETASRQIKNIKKVFDSGASLCAENETDFNGRVLWLDTWLVPLKNEEGEVVAVQGISRDITERKRLEQAKINFLGSVSHELRTPLSLILGYSQMLLKENLPPSAKRKLKVIYERGKQELKLVEELITLAKFESGETHYEMADLRIWNFLKNYAPQAKVMVENLVQKRFHTENFSFTGEISEDLKRVIVHCDEERIRQTLDNLLENAIKYSSRERLEFKLVASLEKNDILIGVTDRGMGIPAEEQAAIFKPFYQVRAGKHPLSDGMGKGLSIVKEHIEAHRGKIWLESAPDLGSSFFFTLPVKEIVEHVDDKVIKKILVVDDDRDIAEFIENLLVGEGFEVRVAYNRTDSLAMLDEESPDLVLLDIQLPDGNGIDICKKLKLDPARDPMFIYLISAKTHSELRAISEEAGADGFVSKPFEIDSFLDMIDNIKG